MAAIFLSYRRDDSAGYAGRLGASLEDLLGPGAVFRDVDALEPGQDFVTAIESRVRSCNAFLAVIGREWLDARTKDGVRRLDDPGDYVRREIGAALARAGLPVIPVLVEGAEMPAAEQLPEELRALTRRHAIALRDDSWEHDVGRLATVLAKALGRTTMPRTAPATADEHGERRRPRYRRAGGILLGALAIALAILLPRISRRGPPAGTPDSVPVDATGTDPAAVAGGDQAGPAPSAIRTIAIPPVSEIELAERVYTLVSGQIERGASGATLRLRFRVMNESSYNAVMGAFLLRVGDETIAATGWPADVVLARTNEDGDVTFALPASMQPVVLVMEDAGESAELPLDLSAEPAGAGPVTPTDARTRAIIGALPYEPAVSLLRADDLEWLLRRLTVRRFANKVRVTLQIGFANQGGYPQYFGGESFRIVMEDGSVRAPVDGPGEAVAARSTSAGDVIFEMPPDTRRFVLRTSWQSTHADRPVDLRDIR